MATFLGLTVSYKQRAKFITGGAALVSTIVIFILAAAIIFWRPPFQVSSRFKQIFVPIILTIIITLLFMLGSFSSNSENPISKSPAQEKSVEPFARQSVCY